MSEIQFYEPTILENNSLFFLKKEIEVIEDFLKHKSENDTDTNDYNLKELSFKLDFLKILYQEKIQKTLPLLTPFQKEALAKNDLTALQNEIDRINEAINIHIHNGDYKGEIPELNEKLKILTL